MTTTDTDGICRCGHPAEWHERGECWADLKTGCWVPNPRRAVRVPDGGTVMSGDFLTITAEERALIEYLRTQPDGVERLRNSILSSGEPGVTHGAPWTSDRLTPCCHRTPFELPMSDRLTCHPSRVTCRMADPA